MTALKDGTLNGLVPAYNGVQFGGSDSDYSLTPPQYDLSIEAVYDDANREVVHFRHVFSVNCWVFGNSESNLSADQDTIRRLLLEPGRSISIGNLGMGFVSQEPDIIWGPKPLTLQLSSVGNRATEINWACEFHTAPCAIESQAGTDPFLKAFNYTTTWSIDQDGNTIRTISGYLEMCQTRDLNNPRQVGKVIDEFRNDLDVKVPPCFRRGPRTFTESSDKTRLDFSVTDIEVLNDVFPQGIADGSGEFGFSTDPVGGTEILRLFPQLQVTLITADGIPYEQGAIKALEIAKAKHDAMKRENPGGTNFVQSLSISRGMFRDANRTTLSIAWMILPASTVEFNNVIKLTALYEPLPDSSYADWRQSISFTWGNRGNRRLFSDGNDDDIISVCDQVGGVTIGSGGQGCAKQEDAPDYPIECPPVDRRYSYIEYDAKVTYVREDDQQAYKPAVSYISAAESTFPPVSQEGLTHPNEYVTNEDTEEVTEQYGLPQQLVKVNFRLARLHYKPEAPRLLSIHGNPVAAEIVKEVTETGTKGDYGCPVHTLRGYIIYRIKGHVRQQIKNVGSPVMPNSDNSEGNL